MKQVYLKCLLFVLLSLTGIKASAYDCVVNGIYYILNKTEKTASVTYYVESRDNKSTYLGSVTIPSTITYNGTTYSVTSIGSSAFWYCSGLTSIVIPHSVTSIGSDAFAYCSGLTSIVIPNSVTSIGSSAFAYCSGLTSIVIPRSVTSIGSDAFAYCFGLTSIVIPNSVTSIGSSAFYGCSGLTSIVIPNSVTSIGSSAFAQCSGLTSIVIPNSVTSIGSDAFAYCRGLTSIVIPNSVTSIGSSAFAYCFGLTSIVIPNSVTTIGESAFQYCRRLTSVTIGNSVTNIGRSAFYGCVRLTTIYSLNPIPPTCEQISLFVCETSSKDTDYYLRDLYDVYTYATLHVPMGSGELYSSAFEWRYFNKIKEDMESNGNIYYANLTVKQGAIGYTRQAVKADARHTIYIGSLGENKVNTVTFNGVDVTDEVENGYYTTPEIKGESVLSISFEINSSVKSISLNNLKVMGNDSEIQIKNIDEPTDVYVYSVDGKLVGNVPAAYGSASIQVAPEALYVVKVGSRIFKVAL